MTQSNIKKDEKNISTAEGNIPAGDNIPNVDTVHVSRKDGNNTSIHNTSSVKEGGISSKSDSVEEFSGGNKTVQSSKEIEERISRIGSELQAEKQRAKEARKGRGGRAKKSEHERKLERELAQAQIDREAAEKAEEARYNDALKQARSLIGIVDSFATAAASKIGPGYEVKLESHEVDQMAEPLAELLVQESFSLPPEWRLGIAFAMSYGSRAIYIYGAEKERKKEELKTSSDQIGEMFKEEA